MDAFSTQCDVIAMNADETKKATDTVVVKSITNTIEGTNAHVNEVEYTSAKEGIKVTIFHLVEEALIDVVEQGRLNTPLVRSLDDLAQLESDRCIDAIAQGMVRSSAPVKRVGQLEKSHIKK